MKALLVSLTMSLGFLAALGAQAQAPATAPAGTTGLCKDGSYYSGETKKGACRGHQGVKEWYGASAAAPAPAADNATKKSRKSKADTETASAAPAAAPAAAAPAGSTGLCKDGTYYSGAEKKGACRGHKGVKEWYGAPAAAGTAAAATTKSSAPMTPAAAPAAPAPAPAAPAPTHSAMPAALNPASRTAAPGGGAGKVWLNTESKVYHCEKDEWYGKTKQGEYTTEADAIAKGAHAAHGKKCS
ncbi:DUF3761 domain-containing protein [Dokdonella soli]|uniref:DUF3761 domain-containing protein n=1 Tax=Dokdonella soli TaxID=529810 RepID=A0ABN1IW93_9GAMM